jgi:SAM-dependent methyltransferase
VNPIHLERCSSDEWADTVKKHIIPWTLEGIELGDDVLEIGPGPGRTTDILRDMTPRLTAIEVDPGLAAALAERTAGSNVIVIEGDATRMALLSARFSAALSFTMLHHVPSPDLQDALFVDVARVLRPGGVFAGVDSLDTPEWRELHVGDTCVPVPPETLAGRLEAAGFCEVRVDVNPYQVRFRAKRPALQG